MALQHRIRSICQKLPFVLPAVTGGCTQEAGFAKFQCSRGLMCVTGPCLPLGFVGVPERGFAEPDTRAWRSIMKGVIAAFSSGAHTEDGEQGAC